MFETLLRSKSYGGRREVKTMDKKMAASVLIVLSLIAAILAALDYLIKDLAPLGLGADSWVIVATALGIYSLYVRGS